jgi:hypothetical protein
MCKKLVKTVIQEYKKGEIYNLANSDINLPKYDYTTYFENSDEELEGEWMAMDKCKKSFRVITKIYE